MKNNELHDWAHVRAELLQDRATAEAFDVVQLRKALLTMLVEKRKSLNLSQTVIARRLGVSRQAISKFEKGNSSPTLDVVFSYAAAMGLDVVKSVGKIFI